MSSDTPIRGVSAPDGYPSDYDTSAYAPAGYPTQPVGHAVSGEVDDDAAADPQAGYGAPAGTVDLGSDPFDDDLSRKLAAAARKTWVNRTSYAIGALVLITAGFLGGIQVQKSYGTGSGSGGGTAAGLAALRARATSSTGTGGFAGFGGAGTGGTGRTPAGQTGTVTLVDGSTLYVTLSDGTVLTVTTNGSTKITTTTTSKVSSIKTGDKVTITGSTPDSGGNMTATAVTDAK